MKRSIVAVVLVAALALSVVGAASADPLTAHTEVVTATCTGLGDVTLVNVFPVKQFGSSGYHVVGSTTVIILFTAGTDRVAQKAGTTCLITSVNGEPFELVTDALIVP